MQVLGLVILGRILKKHISWCLGCNCVLNKKLSLISNNWESISNNKNSDELAVKNWKIIPSIFVYLNLKFKKIIKLNVSRHI